MADIAELSKRLRAEVLKDYSPRIPTQRFNDAANTLNFFTVVFAIRGNMDRVTVPVRLMQNLSALAIQGFEAASGYEYKHEKDALDSVLEKIWYNFTATLMKWVAAQQKRNPLHGELWYSCFQVPAWFAEAVMEDTAQREE